MGASTARRSWGVLHSMKRDEVTRGVVTLWISSSPGIALMSEGHEEALVMLSDILPTGFACGMLNGKVQPGSTVAIVGAGAIRLAALLTARLITHHFKLDSIMDAYNTFGPAAKTGALKIIIEA
jgi:threonine dehydrogenase-like Zn-dependent dehydrogenase